MAANTDDRQASDGNFASLNLRVSALESRMECVELEVQNNNRELAANTALTEEIHGKTFEMYEIFDSTRNGFRMIGNIGNFGLRVIELGGKVAKPLLWIVALGAAGVAWVKTGTFTVPTWLK